MYLFRKIYIFLKDECLLSKKEVEELPQASRALPAGNTLRLFHVPTVQALVLITPPAHSVILFF